MRRRMSLSLRPPVRSEERLRAIAEQEVAVRAGWVNLQAMATARASELTDQFRSDRQNDSQAAALSKAAAEESVAKADQEVGKLMQTMGQRGKLIRSGIGAVDAYSTVLKRTEQCLVADREFVASEVAAGDAALNHFEAEVNAALARKEAEAKEAKEESAEEVAAEEKAVRAAAEERRAALELHRAVADASLKALRGHLEAIRERMQHEETAAEAAEAEAQALEENVRMGYGRRERARRRRFRGFRSGHAALAVTLNRMRRSPGRLQGSSRRAAMPTWSTYQGWPSLPPSASMRLGAVCRRRG